MELRRLDTLQASYWDPTRHESAVSRSAVVAEVLK
jgi:hypothetical protein